MHRLVLALSFFRRKKKWLVVALEKCRREVVENLSFGVGTPFFSEKQFDL